VDRLATAIDEYADRQARRAEELFLLGLGLVIELDEDMAVRADIIVRTAVEAGPEGVDADEDSIGAVAAEQDGFGVIEAGDPILDRQERPGGHWLTVLDLLADADHLGRSEGGL
jgi:hypothetical protein